MCKKCRAVKCEGCVVTELASTYCPRCLENVPSTEAAAYGGRCKKCHECARCPGVALQFFHRKTLGDVYLMCPFCRWSSLGFAEGDGRSSAPSPSELVAALMAAEREGAAQRAFEEELKRLQADHYRFTHERRIEGNTVFASKRVREARSAELDSSASSSISSSSSPSPFSPSSASLDAPPSDGHPRLPEKFKSLERRVESGAEGMGFAALTRLQRSMASLEGHSESLADASSYSLSETDSFAHSNHPQQPRSQQSNALQQSQLPPLRVRLSCRKSKKCRDCQQPLVLPDLGPSKSTFNQLHTASQLLPRLTIDEQLSDIDENQSSFCVSLILRCSPPKDGPLAVSFAPLPDPLSSYCTARVLALPDALTLPAAAPAEGLSQPSDISRRLSLRVAGRLSETPLFSFGFSVVYGLAADLEITVPVCCSLTFSTN